MPKLTRLQTIIRVSLGAILIGLLVSVLDTEAVWNILKQAHMGWFVLALFLAVAANLLSAWRWQIIGSALGLRYKAIDWQTHYMQGIAVNSVMPGGIVGGDLWRASQLRPLGLSMQSVVFDRVSGLWGLAWLSLIFLLPMLALHFSGQGPGGPHTEADPYLEIIYLYGLGLGAVVLAPFASHLVRAAPEGSGLGQRLHQIIRASQSPLLIKTLPLSLLAQSIGMLCFWLCFWAIGSAVSFWWVGAWFAAILISAMLPANLGGFGARELGAVFFLALVGVPSEEAFVASVLFGLTTTIQGAAAIPLFSREARAALK